MSSAEVERLTTLAQITAAADFAKACTEHRDMAMRRAHRSGISLRDIARAAHLGHTTVARIVGK